MFYKSDINDVHDFFPSLINEYLNRAHSTLPFLFSGFNNLPDEHII